MDKGIRQFVIRKFAELLPLRNAQPVDSKTRDKEFRRNVMHAAIEAFDCTIAAAATHYNHALLQAKQATPADVLGLGRPEDKKGGRKKKVVAIVQETEGCVNRDAEIPEDAVGETAAPVDKEETPFEFSTVEPATFVVKKKKDNSIVAEGLSLTAAMEMVAANEGVRFKPALFWE